MRHFKCRLIVPMLGLLAVYGCTQVDVLSSPEQPDIPPSRCLRGWGLDPATTSVVIGDSTKVNLVRNCDAAVPAAVRWRSSDSATARVDSITGWIHGQKAGEATILAEAVANRSSTGVTVLRVLSR